MKRSLFFIACVLASITTQAQEDPNDYIPFVEEGRIWHLVISPIIDEQYYHFYTYWMNEEEEIDGKTYFLVKSREDGHSETYDVGLFREENRRVYKYDQFWGKEFMLYDFSLKEGDTFTYEREPDYPENFKVLKQGWLEDGPIIASPTSPNATAPSDIKYRRLRTWTIGREIESGEYHEFTTWVEGVGSLANMFCPDCTGGLNSLAYVERAENYPNEYLPFSFYNDYGLVHGCNLPTGEVDHSDEWKHQLTYELDGDRLHVYGKAYTQCGPNNYAYFIEETTEDPLVRKLHFVIHGVEPLADCMLLHSTDFYVQGFDPKMNYIVVDNQDAEHPVINKTQQIAYRPFIEDGKMWVLNCSSDADADETMEWTEYCYLDGDTIIGGRPCKKMKSVTDANESNWVNGVFTPGNLPQSYIGAFYEQDKKVYYARNGKQSFELLYDFTISSNDTVYIGSFPMVVKKKSGDIPGFKGTYYELWHEDQLVNRWFEGIGSDSWPYVNHPFMYDGASSSIHACTVGDEVIYNTNAEGDPYLIAAKRERFDFTHTIKTRPKAPKRDEAAQSLYGNYNDLQLDICLAPLNEAYQVQITNESGKVIYDKAINAGGIVALNINISSLAKGRYTVTIENSQELYTGVFESQPSGIADHFMHETKDGSIFNLQGQRLSSLQKGLNIVNGQKVFVK